MGIHGPNRPWEPRDFALVGYGEFGAVKMMGYHPPEAYARLRAQRPGTRFLVRLETPWNELPAPERFVAGAAPRLRELVAAGYAPWVEVGNEPNLELHPHAEVVFADWYAAVLRGLRAAVPEARYGFPGLARDLRVAAWLEANAAAIEASDWLGAHAYWGDEREMRDPGRALHVVRLHARFPRHPVVVTEAGSHAPGLAKRDRARQYAQFVRLLARLPYVRGVYFFIAGGTPDWERYFFDYTMATIVREAAQEVRRLRPGPASPDPPDGARPRSAAASESEPGGAAAGLARPARRGEPTPTPAAFARRVLLTDPAPRPAGDPDGAGPEWWTTAPGLGLAGLRSASGFPASDLSVRLAVAPPASGIPFAVQLADDDLFGAGRTGAAGVALLWDGAKWHLQYRRAGRVVAALELDGAPGAAPDGPAGGAAGAGWLHLELALEARSAAAWVWPGGDPQPARPGAVFAPPPEAALDGARPRALFLPAHPVRDVVLEGGTRFA